MPGDAMANKVNRASQDSHGSWISLAEIRAANRVNRANPVRAASKATTANREAPVRRVHRMAVRTAGQLAVRAAELGPAALVRSIANGTAAIPEATGLRVMKRNPCRLHRKKFSELTRKPCAS